MHPSSDTRPILAFNDPWHDSSFFFSQPQGSTHIESERFTRRKYECINPMVIFCELFEDRIGAFRDVAVQVNAELADYMYQLLALKHGREPATSTLPPLPFVDRWLARRNPSQGRNETAAVKAFVQHLLRPDVTIHLCGHHAAHAANAYFSSAFADALVVTLDGGGRDFAAPVGSRNVLTESEYLDGGLARSGRTYGSVYEAGGNSIRLVHQLRESSVGEIWNRMLPEVLNLEHGQEGTAMAMAALGDPERFADHFRQPVVSYPEVEFLSDPLKEEVAAWIQQLQARVSSDQDRYDVAAAMQEATEQRVHAYLAAHIQPAHRRLCIAGGVFLNCQVTGKIRHWFPQLEGIYIPPAPYDGGLAIGAAQMVNHEVFNSVERFAPGREAPYGMGREYSRLDVLAALDSDEVSWRPATHADFVEGIQEGQIIALFQGSAESGRRALGNRSIMAHPGFPGIKQRINDAVKRRQWFRPFAPMALAENVHEWFDCAPGFSSPYMSFAIPVRREAEHSLANVIHLDHTARVQTVHSDMSPQLHEIMRLWRDRSGIPVLLNTSFNENEPIVETPVDAVRTFLRTPIDRLYFADHGIMVMRA
jgi:carbamoyltransferase